MLVGVWNFYFGPAAINLSVLLLGLFILVLAIIKQLRGKRTCLFEVSFLLFLVSLLYFNLHGWWLQTIFPISLPEKPLVDNNLTGNYTLTSLLTFLVFPVLLLILLRSDVSLERFGLKVFDSKQTMLCAFLGTAFTSFLFLLSNTFFGFVWIPEHTIDGFALWIIFVTFLSVFCQTFFYVGVLFNRYLDMENGLLLAIVSVLAFQMFISASLPWTIANVVGSVAKIMVTWKTRNIYGAALMSITSNLIDILIQIL